MLSSSQERRIAPNTNSSSSLFPNKGSLANDENNAVPFHQPSSEAEEGWG
jgi:hypothetical protein